jgi:hypothetical protein
MRALTVTLALMVTVGGASLAAAEMKTQFYNLDGQRLDLLRTVVLTGHDDANAWMEQLLRQWGVTFPPGSSVQCYERQRKLIFHNTKENLRTLEDALYNYGLRGSVILGWVQRGQDKAKVLAAIAEQSGGKANTKGTVLLTDMPTAGIDDSQAAEIDDGQAAEAVMVVLRSRGDGPSQYREVGVLLFGRDGKLVDYVRLEPPPTAPQ